MYHIVDIIVIRHIADFPKIVPHQRFIDFLYLHLGEFRDSKEDISKAIDYAFSTDDGKGGFLLLALDKGIIVGEVVVNDSGMSGYIPEHVLVFIAVEKKYRGKGIGKQLLEKVIKECDGDISLHVEYDNPAFDIYKHIGFKSKYAEMRYTKKGV